MCVVFCDFFHFVKRIQVSSVLEHVFVPFHGHFLEHSSITFCLFFHPSVGIRVVSTAALTYQATANTRVQVFVRACIFSSLGCASRSGTAA